MMDSSNSDNKKKNSETPPPKTPPARHRPDEDEEKKGSPDLFSTNQSSFEDENNTNQHAKEIAITALRASSSSSSSPSSFSSSSRTFRKQQSSFQPERSSTTASASASETASQRVLLDAQAKARGRKPRSKARHQPKRAMPSHPKTTTSSSSSSASITTTTTNSNSTMLQRLQEEVAAKERSKATKATTMVQRRSPPQPSMGPPSNSSNSIGTNISSLSAVKQLNRMEADIASKQRARAARGQGAKRTGSATTSTSTTTSSTSRTNKIAVPNRLDRMEAEIAAKAKVGRASAALKKANANGNPNNNNNINKRTTNRNDALARKLQKSRASNNTPATTPGAVSLNEQNGTNTLVQDSKKNKKESTPEGSVTYASPDMEGKKKASSKNYQMSAGSHQVETADLVHSAADEAGNEERDKNNKLAVAVAVEEDENVFIPSAVEYDPEAVAKVVVVPIYKNQRFRVYSLLSCTILIIIAACSITVLTVLEKQAARVDVAPTEAPTCVRCTSDFVEYIELEVGITRLNDPTSPEYMAKEWIIHEDPQQLWPSDAAFIQRYLLAAFYFDTHQVAEWRSCNRQNPDPAKNETEQCDFLKVTGIKPMQFQAFESNRWLSSDSECTWAGVTCDDSATVRRIDLHGQGIEGTLPVSFARFPFAQTLSLQLNNFTGTLPEEYSRMKHIVYMELHGNKLTGTFPASWSNIRNLQQLNLAENQLTGQLPSKIGNFRTIKGLYLYNNKFSGTIPPEISNANSLSYVRLQKNAFTGTIPPEIADMQLVELWLQKNEGLTGSLPDEIGKLSNSLADLRLDTTSVGGQIPESFTALNQLFRFDAGKARFSGTLPANITKLGNLQMLGLNFNQLTGTIPSGMESMTSLNELELHGNYLSGTAPSGLCALKEDFRLQFLSMDCLGNPESNTVPEIACECYDDDDVTLHASRSSLDRGPNNKLDNANRQSYPTVGLGTFRRNPRYSSDDLHYHEERYQDEIQRIRILSSMKQEYREMAEEQHSTIAATSVQQERDVAVVQPSFDDHESRRLSPEKKPMEMEVRKESSRRDGHHRNLSEHFEDATKLTLSESERKHKRDYSADMLNPAQAHRRIDSTGGSTSIQRSRPHRRIDSSGLDALTAAADFSREELEAANQGRQPWSQHSNLRRSPIETAKTFEHGNHAPAPVPHPSPPHPSPPHPSPPHHASNLAHTRQYPSFQPMYYGHPSYPPAPYPHTYHYPHHHPGSSTSGRHHGQPMHPPPPNGYPVQYARPHGRDPYMKHHAAPLQQPILERPHSDSPTRRNPSPTVTAIDHKRSSEGDNLAMRPPPAPPHWPRSGSTQGVQTYITGIGAGETTRTIHANPTPAHPPPPQRSSPTVGHHRKLSSLSNLGPIFFGPPDGSVNGGRAHHRSTSSSLSFLNSLDVNMNESADATFLRNLQESTGTPAAGYNAAKLQYKAEPAVPSSAVNSSVTQSKLMAGGTSKRVRRKCTVMGCDNRVVQGGLCIAHGAKRKLCKFPGCKKHVKKAGLCSTHGPARKRCEVENCTKVAVQGGRCIAHGAKKKLCSIDQCTKQAILGGMCKKHHDQKASGEEPVTCTIVPTKKKPKKPTHTRGLSIFQEISADAVGDLLSPDDGKQNPAKVGV